MDIVKTMKTAGAMIFALIAALGCAGEVARTPTAAPSASAPSPTAAATAMASESTSKRESPPSDEGDFRTLDAENLEIVTLLGFDAIPAILEPEFVDAARAGEWLEDDDLVIGVSVNGDSRAYSVPMLSAHEIVNDVVGGEPIAVTW